MSQNSQLTSDAVPILSFEDPDDGTGVSIVDHIEGRRCEVRTPREVTQRAVSAEKFHLPIDCAVALATERLFIPHTVSAHVRGEDGTLIEEAAKNAELTFQGGFYRIELAAPIKLYIVVEEAFEITVTADDVTIAFGEKTEVYLGARSNHDHPATTITTTDDPEALMRAVSQFGSALKTTTCERSYPTLRGHPPRVERGDRLTIPEGLDAPDTGITIQVPLAYEAVYVVASLAYYLGADVVPGSEPVILNDDGFVHHLGDTKRGFEGEVERVLKQCFVLDCVTRTEGHYPVELHERNEIENDVTLDFSALYERPVAEQLEAYLDVPYEVVEPHVPRWKLTAHVDPIAAHAETLPFLVQDLAAIRSKEAPSGIPETGDRTAESLGITQFVRGEGDDRPLSDESTGFESRRTVRIEGSDALEDVWIGDGIPIGASKGMIEAFQNRLERTPSDGNIDITVVVNDPGMIEEGRDVNEVYGSREELPFEVTTLQTLTTDELADVLYSETDFLHYIGHIDEGGFECTNGYLDVRDLSMTGVDAFFLNACKSYKQGKHLIKIGATSGVTTLAPVLNKEACQVGKKLARLLNLGFPFYAAVEIASLKKNHENYIIIGDNTINIVQPDSDIASLLYINESDGFYESIYETYPTVNTPFGSMMIPYLGDNLKYFLVSGRIKKFKLNEKELREFISLGRFPIIKNSEIYWNDTDATKPDITDDL